MEVLAMKVKNSIKEVLKPLIQGTLAEHLMKVGAGHSTYVLRLLSVVSQQRCSDFGGCAGLPMTSLRN